MVTASTARDHFTFPPSSASGRYCSGSLPLSSLFTELSGKEGPFRRRGAPLVNGCDAAVGIADSSAAVNSPLLRLLPAETEEEEEEEEAALPCTADVRRLFDDELAAAAAGGGGGGGRIFPFHTWPLSGQRNTEATDRQVERPCEKWDKNENGMNLKMKRGGSRARARNRNMESWRPSPKADLVTFGETESTTDDPHGGSKDKHAFSPRFQAQTFPEGGKDTQSNPKRSTIFKLQTVLLDLCSV